MNKHSWSVLSLILTVSLLAACAAPATPTPPPTAKPAAAAPATAPTATVKPWRVCFVYGSAVGDAGWTFAQDQGRKYVEQKLGIKTSFVENVPAGADAERVFSQFAEQGCDQIISTTNTHSDAVDRVAPKYPKVFFEGYEALKPYPNLRAYRLQNYQAYYLIGMLAAKMSKSGVAGWVAGFGAPPFPAQANSMIMGARSINPKFQLKIVFLNKWADPPAEKQATESLVAAGADFIVNSMSSPSVIKTADELKVYSIGRTEQCSYGPNYCAASFVVKWGPLFERLVRAAMDGTWKSDQVTWVSLDKDEIGLAEIGKAVPEDVRQLLDATKKKIASGELVYFKGPISNLAGEVKVAAGQTLTPDEINRMDWYTTGIQTSATN